MLFPADLLDQAARIVALSRRTGRMLATAESCTGGGIAALLTEIPGSSGCLERGFVTYSNAAKTQMLDVPAALIAAQGAVSAEVAAAMAQGALRHSAAQLAVSVTGIAGPDGGTAQKPVGLVFLGGMTRGGRVETQRHIFNGDRAAVRLHSMRAALQIVEGLLQL